MIPAERFLASKHLSEDAWRAARKTGVTATAVAEVAAKRDRAAGIAAWLNPEPFDGNPYTEWGNEQEPALIAVAHREFGILPSDWVIQGEQPGHLATPDGLSLDHTLLAEGKTTGDGWDRAADGDLRGVPVRYRRQMQWQMHVTGAEKCLLVWQLRVEDRAWFRPAWFTPRTLWVPRDDAEIQKLIVVAEDMLAALYERSAA